MIALVLLGFMALQEPDLDALLKQLEDESIEVREKAMAALLEAGDKALPKLKARAASADATLRSVCERLIERISVPKELRKAIPPLRKVTLSATDRSLKEVFDDFQSQTGLTLSLESVGEGTVTVQVKDAAPLEALAAVCKAAQCGYHIDMGSKNQWGVAPGGGGRSSGADQPRIRILPGSYSDAPRVFVRHYAVEASNLSLTKSTNFQAQNSQGHLQLRLNWLPGMEPDQAYLEIQSLTDDQGRSLIVDAMRDVQRRSIDRGFGGMRGWSMGYLDHGVQVKYPEPDAKTIGSVKGTAVLKYVVGEKIVSFENPAKAVGEKREHGARTLELLDWQQDGENLTVKLKFTSTEPRTDASLRQRADGRHFRFKTEDGS